VHPLLRLLALRWLYSPFVAAINDEFFRALGRVNAAVAAIDDDHSAHVAGMMLSRCFLLIIHTASN
jgi:hypothetical protein